MEFPGVSKKQYVEFPGDLLFGLRIFKGSNTISRSGALFNLELPGVKKWIIPQGFSNKYVLNPTVIFWNSPTHSMFDPRNWITSSMKINITVYFKYIQNNLIFQNNFKRNITY